MVKPLKFRNYPDFDLVLIDADSLMYSIAWGWQAAPREEKQDILDNAIMHAMRMCDVDEAAVFIKGKDNFRKNIDVEYKLHRRKYIDPFVQQMIDDLYEYAKEFSVESDHGEADDYCSIYSLQALAENKLPVIAHIDKDLNMLPGWHYNFRTKEMYFVSEEEAHIFLCKQLLTGDLTDNIKGIKGVGPAKATKYLNNKKMPDLVNKVLDVWKEKGGQYWEDDFYRCANLIILRDTEEELRELSREEIDKRLTWQGDPDKFYFDGITDTPQVAKANQVTTEGTLCRIVTDTGIVEDAEEAKLIRKERKKRTMGSSTKSSSSSLVKDTLVKNPSGVKLGRNKKNLIGKLIPARLRKSMLLSKNTGKNVSRLKSLCSVKLSRTGHMQKTIFSTN